VTGRSPQSTQLTGFVGTGVGAQSSTSGSNANATYSSTQHATTGGPSTAAPASSTSSSSTAASDYIIASASFSASPATAVAAPSTLTAVATGTGKIALNWQNNASNNTGFKIFRSTDGTNFSRIATVGSTVLTYTDSGLTAGTTYYYEIKAYI